MKKDFLTIKDLSPEEIDSIFLLARDLKKDKFKFKERFVGKTFALIFQKPSNRTRVSFDVGIGQLGGHTLYLKPEDINLGVRESIKDTAKTLSRYVDAVIMRTFSHQLQVEFAQHATIPVINGLSDLLHPCQALADLFTIKEKFGKFNGITLSYVGDGNNVCHSLLYGASKVGLNLKIATPKRYAPLRYIVDEAVALAKKSKAEIYLSFDPKEAVKDSDIVYTDVWTSMGHEREAKKRRRIFANFQVNRELMSLAKPDALVMHCLPAHRGEEISDEVIDGPNSIVFDQAENRLHVQKAILLRLNI